jgi:hypothetical protein
MWRVYLLSALIACVAGAATAFITVQLTKPAVPQNSGTDLRAGTVTLEGEEYLEFPKGNVPSEWVVYYKTPFASPPNLTFPNEVAYDYKITDQKAESFKLQRVLDEVIPELKVGEVRVGRAPKQEIYATSKLKWKAEGQPAK